MEFKFVLIKDEVEIELSNLVIDHVEKADDLVTMFLKEVENNG